MARSYSKDRKLNGREKCGSIIGPVQFLVRENLEHYSEPFTILTEGSSVGDALPRSAI